MPAVFFLLPQFRLYFCLNGCRQKDGRWLIGETAYATALAGEGSVTDKLIRLVLQDGSDTIYGVKYRAVDLLKYFLEQQVTPCSQNPSKIFMVYSWLFNN